MFSKMTILCPLMMLVILTLPSSVNFFCTGLSLSSSQQHAKACFRFSIHRQLTERLASNDIDGDQIANSEPSSSKSGFFQRLGRNIFRRRKRKSGEDLQQKAFDLQSKANLGFQQLEEKIEKAIKSQSDDLIESIAVGCY